MELPTSILRRESAPVVGLLEAIAVYALYSHAIPGSVADVRSVSPDNSDIESARKHAAIESTVLLGVVFCITRDFNAFIIGGIATILVDMSFKHANMVNPATGRAQVPNPTIANVYPLSNEYDDQAQYS